jgi:alkyl hydroperoxide reductase subunit AhpC/predicted Ser/Thr protein kinase
MLTSLIGQSAPHFDLNAVSFDDPAVRQVSLSAFAGQWLLLLFYPRDFSFVCPTELTAFSAHLDDFRSRRCAILALSVDSVDDHRRWFETPIRSGGIGPLQFPLAADPNGAVSRAYGVWMEDSGCSARGLFIIDPEGVLQYSVAHNTSVGRSVEETLRVLDALQSGGLCPASWTAADGTIDVEEQLQPGRVLGNFRIVEQLGVGAFGSVFAADDLSLDRRVAIKIIGRKASTARDQVLAEAGAAAKLHHKNICTVFSVDSVETVPVIVMEFIDGQPLSNCDLAAFDADARRHIALGIAEGLAEAQAHGVVHGDLKPANIMVSRAGDAKLLDFGLSRRDGAPNPVESHAQRDVVHDPHLEDTVIGGVPLDAEVKQPVGLTGTPAYMSPELTWGLPASFQSDVFAFGLILVQLLTGRVPARPMGLTEVLEQTRSGAIRRAASETVPPAFRDFVNAVLADRPEDRPAMAEVIELLRDHEFVSAD